jgi:signal transduction histidine kinase
VLLKLVRTQLLIVFLAVAAVPATVAGWLAWRLLAQDGVITVERLREIRERRADEVVQSLSRSIMALLREAQTLPTGAVKPLGAPLAYATEPRQLPEAPNATFAPGELAEFRAGGAVDAIEVYRKLTASPQPAIRAGAWLRLGRVWRKLGRHDEAIGAYGQLSLIENASAGGAPAPLTAQWAICTIAEETGSAAELREDGEKLRVLLYSGRYSLGRSLYEAYADDAARWSGKARPVVSEAMADAAAAFPSANGAGIFRGVQITWLAADSRTILLSPEYSVGLLPSGEVRVRFSAKADRNESLRRAEDTGLPWPLAIALADPNKVEAEFATRRTLLLWLLAVVAALGVGGGYLGWRMIQRELALAQMQADLVAAVSHEFRTPLTSMRQISDALSDGRVSDEERKQAYYQALSRATERLHRLVEGLLDFGKMESGAMPYHMESLNLAAMTAGVAREFSRDAAEKGFTIHVDVPVREVEIKGDAEALARGLWNLLDNAVKYSGDSREVWVTLSRNGSEAALRVADKGAGIPASEQQEVFRKFFRGAVSRDRRIRGTGIGLTMLDHIVRAHGGRVTLESQFGVGSTFTMHFPVEPE